jgi:4-hydroxybenzoate polyprenyltransferase
MPSRTAASILRRLVPYAQMARADHWFKNAFMSFGILLAWLHAPETLDVAALPRLLLALLATCIVASSNYVLNEYLDAPSDREHPTKRYRPAALGLVTPAGALGLWATLACLGLWLASQVNASFAFAALALWGMGCLYNVPPVRTKDLPYLDVLSESVNNPLRLLLGWFALVPEVLPSLSLALSYWMAGGFFMAAKRFAEYRRIGDPARAARYRASFRHYDEGRLLMSMAAYLVAGGAFAGAFLVRFKLELVFVVPIAAALFGYYAKLALREDSPVQAPEKLYREPLFLALASAFVLAFATLVTCDMPWLYTLFDMAPAGAEPLWKLAR